MMESQRPAAHQTLLPAIGVGGLAFNTKGQVLLVQRRYPPQAGMWHIPGGRLEPHETLIACCQREILEETGINIIPGPIIAVADRMIEGFHYVIIDFLITLAEGDACEPVASSDALEARWVDVTSLGDYPLVEGILEVIKSGLALLQGSSPSVLTQHSDHPWLFTGKARDDDGK